MNPFGDVVGEQLGISTFFTSDALEVVPVPHKLTADILKR